MMDEGRKEMKHWCRKGGVEADGVKKELKLWWRKELQLWCSKEGIETVMEDGRNWSFDAAKEGIDKMMMIEYGTDDELGEFSESVEAMAFGSTIVQDLRQQAVGIAWN